MTTSITCFDCGCGGIDTTLYLWNLDVNPVADLCDGMLCTDCLEKRLGHKLEDDDFTGCVMSMSARSAKEIRQ